MTSRQPFPLFKFQGFCIRFDNYFDLCCIHRSETDPQAVNITLAPTAIIKPKRLGSCLTNLSIDENVSPDDMSISNRRIPGARMGPSRAGSPPGMIFRPEERFCVIGDANRQ